MKKNSTSKCLLIVDTDDIRERILPKVNLTCMKLLIAIKKWNQGCMEILKNQWKDLTNGFCFSVPSNASALSGSPYEFEGDRAGDAFWVMRLIGYPGLLTLVSQDDDITALQVRNLSDEWISAPPVLGTFVCNIGGMLKTNFDTAVEPWTFAERSQAELIRNSKAVYGEHLVKKVLTNFVH
ncbi:hypothetical protein EV1_018524 [Malus domestica]